MNVILNEILNGTVKQLFWVGTLIEPLQVGAVKVNWNETCFLTWI